MYPLSHSSFLKFTRQYVSRGRLRVRVVLAQEAPPRYPTLVHPSGYCGNLKKCQHWVCRSFLFLFMISGLRRSLSGSVSMDQEDVGAAQEIETPCVFLFIYTMTALLMPLRKTQKAKEDSPNCCRGRSYVRGGSRRGTSKEIGLSRRQHSAFGYPQNGLVILSSS